MSWIVRSCVFVGIYLRQLLKLQACQCYDLDPAKKDFLVVWRNLVAATLLNAATSCLTRQRVSSVCRRSEFVADVRGPPDRYRSEGLLLK